MGPTERTLVGRRLKLGGAWSATLGIVALAAAFLRMGTLVSPTETGPPWQVLFAGAFVLGVALVVIGRALRIRLAGSIAVGLLVLAAVMGRIVDPSTMYAGLVPTIDTWDAMASQLALGLEALRYGTAPLYPIPAFLLLLFPAFVAVGFAWAWLAAEGRGVAAAVVPAGLYLAVAIADQTASSTWWVLGSVAWVGVLLAVAGWEETTSAPRVLGTPGRAGVAAAGTLVVVMALVATDVASGAVPQAGSVPWREAGAFGSGSGVSLNLFASEVQTNLVSQSEEVVFSARVAGAVDPARLYWPLVTLDRYDGRNWAPTFEANRAVDGNVLFEQADQRYQGQTARVAARVRVGALRMQALPTIYSVRRFTDRSDSPLLDRAVRARNDGALILSGGFTRAGLEYEIESEVPTDSLVDVALGADGDLPDLFERAQAAGEITVSRATGTGSDLEPADLDRFTDLPDGLDPGIGALAASITDGATHPLERLHLLEFYFRGAGNFQYSTDIQPGHAADDLADWLLVPDSPNYHVGYCEQFATAMGVMARSLGIPTRLVLGFSPGRVVEQDGATALIEVQGRNAHSWVEAWIDGVGWVRFDPTPRSEGDNPATTSDLGGVNLATFIDDSVGNPMSAIPDSGVIIFNPDRVVDDPFLAGDVPTPDFLPEGGPIESTGTPFSIPDEVWWGLLALLGLAAIPIAKWIRRWRRLSRARHGDISAAWAEITDRLRDLDRPVTAAMTPNEIARATVPELAPLAAFHGQASWGGTPPDAGTSEQAIASFERTEQALRRSTPFVRRLMAAWRPRSLVRR